MRCCCCCCCCFANVAPLPPFLHRVHSDHTSPPSACPPNTHTQTLPAVKLAPQPQLFTFPQTLLTVTEGPHCGRADQCQVRLHREIFRSSRAKKKKRIKSEKNKWALASLTSSMPGLAQGSKNPVDNAARAQYWLCPAHRQLSKVLMKSATQTGASRERVAR